MSSSTREEISETIDAFRDVVSRLCSLSFDALTTPERLALLQRLEDETRRLPVPRHELVNGVRREATPAEIGGKLPHVLADRLRITRGEATRRIQEAQDLGSRTALSGESLPAHLPATAAGQRAGAIGEAHVRVIRAFLRDLPCWIDAETREHAEAQLAEYATQYRPELLAKLAHKLAEVLNPDGQFSDEDRARRRSLTLGNQDIDGMSPIRGWLTPTARAALEAVLARWAAPGMCNPADAKPCLDGTPSEEAIQGDSRSPGQRHHDALAAALQATLASGKLGQHNGLPASIIITTTLQELEAAAGTARTGGGSLLPMNDVIRMAQHAHNYSPASGRYPQAIFDKAKPLALLHRKRLASKAQRLMLYAGERGCSHPGCDVPPYFTEVHHVTPWAQCRQTNIRALTLGCRPHHKNRRAGLDHPQKQKRAHRMDSATPPRPRPTPRQRVPSPRKTFTEQRGRRRSVTADQCSVGAYRSTAPTPSAGWVARGPRPLGVPVRGHARIGYSPVNFGGRLANVAAIPSDRSLDGRNAAFHAAT